MGSDHIATWTLARCLLQQLLHIQSSFVKIQTKRLKRIIFCFYAVSLICILHSKLSGRCFVMERFNLLLCFTLWGFLSLKAAVCFSGRVYGVSDGGISALSPMDLFLYKCQRWVLILEQSLCFHLMALMSEAFTVYCWCLRSLKRLRPIKRHCSCNACPINAEIKEINHQGPGITRTTVLKR